MFSWISCATIVIIMCGCLLKSTITRMKYQYPRMILSWVLPFYSPEFTSRQSKRCVTSYICAAYMRRHFTDINTFIMLLWSHHSGKNIKLIQFKSELIPIQQLIYCCHKVVPILSHSCYKVVTTLEID